MSKTSFRPRQVDYSKHMPIYLNDELPDLQDYSSINRTVPQMPSGMEKEEESEHHLQRALSAQQVFGISSTDYAIPTPKVEIDNKKYDRIYNLECPKSKSYIRIQPFSNDSEYADYDCDSEDEEWLNECRKTLKDVDFKQFEEIMDRLEKATGHSTNLMTADEAKIILKDETNNELVKCIYEYWKQKRLKYKHPLTPIVLTDKSGVQTQPSNPYLVFRRRTEKMQTRKNRKNEEQSYEKMLILRRDLMRAQKLLQFIKQRETYKKDFLKLTLDLFEKRYNLNDYDGTVYNTIYDRLTASLKPQTASYINNSSLNTNSNNHRQLLTSNLNTQQNEKNVSSIDKTIVNLINSNELKTLGSPPHSSLKRVPQLDNSNYLVKSIVKTQSNINDENKLKLDKRRHKKQQQHLLANKLDSSSSSTTTSLLPQKSATSTPSVFNKNLIKNNSNKASTLNSRNLNINKVSSSSINDNSNSTTCSSSANSNDLANNESSENNVKNIESVINEILNSLSTSYEKDGYWCFKPKEGCKYLPQKAPAEPFDTTIATAECTTDFEKPQNKYAFSVSRRNRHLGLVRRRVGRGGRVILDRYNKNNNINIPEIEKINTYYSKEQINNNDRLRVDENDDNFNKSNNNDNDSFINEDNNHTYDHNLFSYQLEQLNCLNSNNNKSNYSTNPTAAENKSSASSINILNKIKTNSSYRMHPYYSNISYKNLIINENDSKKNNKNSDNRATIATLIRTNGDNNASFDDNFIIINSNDNSSNLINNNDLESGDRVAAIDDDEMKQQQQQQQEEMRSRSSSASSDSSGSRSSSSSSESFSGNRRRNGDSVSSSSSPELLLKAKCEINNNNNNNINLNSLKLNHKAILNNEYNSKSNDCLLDIVNVKFAIKTLKYITNKTKKITNKITNNTTSSPPTTPQASSNGFFEHQAPLHQQTAITNNNNGKQARVFNGGSSLDGNASTTTADSNEINNNSLLKNPTSSLPQQVNKKPKKQTPSPPPSSSTQVHVMNNSVNNTEINKNKIQPPANNKPTFVKQQLLDNFRSATNSSSNSNDSMSTNEQPSSPVNTPKQFIIRPPQNPSELLDNFRSNSINSNLTDNTTTSQNYQQQQVIIYNKTGGTNKPKMVLKQTASLPIQQQSNTNELLDNFRTNNSNDSNSQPNRSFQQQIANSSSLPSASPSSISIQQQQQQQPSSNTKSNIAISANGPIVNGTSKDDFNNTFCKKSQNLLQKLNFNQTPSVNTSNSNKFKMNDQPTPNLIDTSSHKTNGDSLNDNLAMEVT